MTSPRSDAELTNADLAEHQSRLARFLVETTANMLGAAALAMFVAFMVVGLVTKDFPGTWLIAVAGIAAATITAAYAAERVPSSRR